MEIKDKSFIKISIYEEEKRQSLSYKLKKILEVEAKEIFCSNIYIKEQGFVSPEKLIEKSEIIILATPHKKYKKLDIKDKILIDLEFLWKKIKNKKF